MANRILLSRRFASSLASRRTKNITPGFSSINVTSSYQPAGWNQQRADLYKFRSLSSRSENDRDLSTANFPLQYSTGSVPLTEWIWRQVQVPKGFENFFPKGGSGSGKGNGPKKPSKNDKTNENKTRKEASTIETDRENSKSETGSSDAKKEAKDSFKPGAGFGNFGNNKNTGGQKGSGSGGPNSNKDSQQLGGLTALLIMLALTNMVLGDENTLGNGGKEITWSDFRNYMLESGDVERIVVTNKNTARVFLRHGARGVPVRNSRHGAGATGAFSSPGSFLGKTSSTSNSKASTGGIDGWEDSTVMDMGERDSITMGSTSADPYSASGGNSARLGHQQDQQQLVYHFSIGSVESFERKLEDAQRELGVSPRDFVPVQYSSETSWGVEILKVLPTLFILGGLWFAMRNMGGGGVGGGGGGMGNVFKIGKSNAKKVGKEDVNVTFKDVAGCAEAKKEIMEFVDFLQDGSRFTKLGAKIPKGALLCGPPGTGKTLLAKAVAGEAAVPFFSISGSDFIEMFVGVGPSRVRDLFKEARENAPCIVFIDEIDAVGRARGKGGFSGGNDERENTLNQLLVEMDGFSPSSGVVVLAGTNRADILDNALTRPGRFDRQIMVDKPDLNGRKDIFEVHLKGITLEGAIGDVSGRLAGLTPGFTGADIANIANEAAIQAARRKGDSVIFSDFEKAIDRIIGGLESGKLISKSELAIVAHHEAGHAVAGWFLEHADPLLKVTIVPRTTGALGFAQYLPKEMFLRTEDQIMDIVCMALAGRAAEEIFFNRVTTGASDDLKRVTEMVYGTIQTYGMNERVGQLAFPKDPNAGFGEGKPYSDATAQAMDEEARRIVNEAYQRTLDLLKEKKDEVDKVAKLLLEKETINHDDIIDLIGERPFAGDDAYNEYVSKRKKDKDPEESKADGMSEDAVVDENGNGHLTPGLV
eukprot:CAMPEP_0195517788 /NCGR_PEP_ID=MMETSP0794_2-20130614/11671_1 /TAXON_ID=515487 /ORGANISM="Stephanopyxis turris, Strain CCMP 815" /LENGTH=930 /DNA_ID=CAMNT_0040646659 /DNA_START=35 /DNA_END=2827 /DNA_ORIENTATION=-